MSPRDDMDATEVKDEQAGTKTPKKGSPILIYIVIAVLMLAAGYFVGTTFSKSSSDEPVEAKKSDKTELDELKAQGETGSARPGEIYMMEDIIVNPAGTGGTRFLSVSIGFEIKSGQTKALFKEREPIIKDALITILGSKTISQLSNAKEKEITRYQIRKRVEQLLHVDDVAAVYFTDFILQ